MKSSKLATFLTCVCILPFLAHAGPATPCVDCGPSGWQKLERRCDSKITESTTFISCLKAARLEFPETQDQAVKMVTQGQLEIGSPKKLSKPTKKSRPVLFFRQWAADQDGNLYLLGQLG